MRRSRFVGGEFVFFRRALITGALFVIIIAGISMAIARRERRANMDAFVKNLQEGQTFLKNDDARAIKKLEEATTRAGSEEQRAAAEVALGVAYISQKDLESVEKGVLILKKAAAEEAYSPYYRAGALMYIAGIYPSSLNAEFAKSYIFSGDPQWSSFLQGGDMDAAVRRAYEQANAMFPTARASYNIALWYGRKLLEDGISPSQALLKEQREIYTDLFRVNVKEGDNLLEVILRKGTLDNDPKERAFLFQLRGMAHGAAYELSKAPQAKDLAETSFRLALAASNEDPALAETENTLGVRLFIQYQYAIFLSRLEKAEMERQHGKVQELLASITEAQNKNVLFFSYLKNLNGTSGDTRAVEKERARAL
ncbi:MAG: hypothetical protein AAB904_00925, partial [Patescibacteria group bacterium]